MKIIATADWHSRDDRPLCRKDPDWLATQQSQIDFIIDEANKRKAKLLIAGDVFDVPRTSPVVVNMLMRSLQRADNDVIMIAGNHSLQYHNQDNLMNSSIGAFKYANKENIIYLDCVDNTNQGVFEHAVSLPFAKDIEMIHTLVFPSEDEIPYGAKAHDPDYIFERYKGKYLITGDYHKSFIVEKNGRYLINPGCINIQSADMLDYDPVIYYIDTDAEVIEKIPIPEDKSVLTDNHISEKKERDNRITSFIETVRKHGKLSLSFMDNLRKAMELNQIEPDVIDIIEEIAKEKE